MWDQLVVGAAPGDAITRSAVLIRNELLRLGPSDIFAQHREPPLDETVRPLSELSERHNSARPLVVHVSMGSWPVYEAVRDHASQVIVIYHNFSPPEHYVEHAPSVASDLIQGRWELAQLRPRTVRAIADSDYNAAELEELGFEDVEVVPPTPDTARVTRLPADPSMLERIDSWGAGPLVLSVGQQFPHKRIDRVLATAALLEAEFYPGVRLAMAGVERFPAFTHALHTLSRTLALPHAHFLGRVSDEELASLFLRADCLLLMSDHEGFSVPLVEAMAAGVPIVAADRGAIASTLGEAGILVDDPDDPVLTAGLVDRVLRDPALRRTLVGRGVARAKAMSAAATLPRLLQLITSADSGTPAGGAS